MAEIALRFSDVTKEYRGGRGIGRVRALDELNLLVPRGTVVGLVGPNGCGKSTALKAALGLVAIERGEIRWGDRKAGDPEVGPLLGYMPERGGVPSHLTGSEALRWWARICGAAESPVAERLDEVGLSAAADRRVSTYSKGMRQRLALAQALVTEPGFLLLDEPFSGVDPLGVDRLVKIIGERRDRGTTVLLTSHLMPRIEEICDNVVLLSQGKAIAIGSPEKLVGEKVQRSRGLEDVFRERLGGERP